MELGKFIFMGFVPKEKRLGLIEAYISELKKELDALVIISTGTQPRYAFDENYTGRCNLVHFLVNTVFYKFVD